MQVRTYRKKIRHKLVIALLTASGCCAVTVPLAASGENQPALSVQSQTEPGASVPQPPVETPTAVPSHAAGLRVYIDPQTGAFLPEPAPGTVPLRLTPELQNAFSTSHQGLVEVPSAVPGGGFKLDLRGRFQSPLLATIDANGKVKMQHLHELPQSSDNQ